MNAPQHSDVGIECIDAAMDASEVELRRLNALSADLASYAIAIEALGTVDRTTALSLESIAEGTLNTERYPLSGYTAAPSRTNYTATLEGIGDSLLRISKKIIEAIIAFFKKIAEFFRKLWAHFTSQERKRAAVEAEIDEVVKATLHLLQNCPPERKVAVEAAIQQSRTELDDVLAVDIQKANRELLHALISNNHTHRAYVAMGHSYVDYLESISNRVVLLDAEIRVVKEHPDVVEPAIINIEKELNTNRWINHELNNELRALQLLKANTVDPHEIASAINALRYRVEDLFNQRSSSPITLAEILKSDVRRSFIVKLDNVSRYYEGLESQIRHLDTLTHYAMPTGIHSAIVKLATLIRLEYHAATHFLIMSVHYSTMATEATRLKLRAELYIDGQARKARARNPE